MPQSAIRPWLIAVLVVAVAGGLAYQARWLTSPYDRGDYVGAMPASPTGARVYRVALSAPGREAFERGTAALLAGDVDGAVRAFESLVDEEPNSPTAHEQLGRALLLAGRREAAVEAFTEAFVLGNGDAYLEAAMQRWLKAAREGQYSPFVDALVERQFPGQLPWFIEHRVRPMREGFLGASYVLLGEHRFSFPTPAGVPFELLARSEPGRGTVVFGSSRAREGFKPPEFQAGAAASFAPAVNLAASQSAPTFWLGATRYLEAALAARGGTLHAAIILADPESLADTWLREFKPPAVASPTEQAALAAGTGQRIELWPLWTGLNGNGRWHIPDNWRELAADPFTNGLNHARQGQAYQFDGAGEQNPARFIELLGALKRIATHVVVVDVPVFPGQYALASQASSRPLIERICREQGVHYVHRSPADWGLDERHFFGAKAYPLDKIDWWHMNYAGARAFSAELGRLMGALPAR